ncbi:MAG: transposase [Spirochaetes bacterium]|nr:transposase [Spirochaetota bacterium]
MHRDSQKRIYLENAVYFITTVTKERYPYFHEKIVCDLLAEDIRMASELKQCDVIAYKINPDHVYLIIRPLGKPNYSEFMHNMKRVSSLHINYSMGMFDFPEGADIYLRLRENRLTWQSRYNTRIDIPKFAWQKSYRDHLVRDDDDLIRHVEYIRNQWIKHDLQENAYCFVSEAAMQSVLE